MGSSLYTMGSDCCSDRTDVRAISPAVVCASGLSRETQSICITLKASERSFGRRSVSLLFVGAFFLFFFVYPCARRNLTVLTKSIEIFWSRRNAFLMLSLWVDSNWITKTEILSVKSTTAFYMQSSFSWVPDKALYFRENKNKTNK